MLPKFITAKIISCKRLKYKATSFKAAWSTTLRSFYFIFSSNYYTHKLHTPG